MKKITNKSWKIATPKATRAPGLSGWPKSWNDLMLTAVDDKATATLRRIADQQLVIAGTGANDWLESSGEMTPVDGGYRVTARKHFVSGGPGAQVFVSSATLAGEHGSEVLVELLHR